MPNPKTPALKTRTAKRRTHDAQSGPVGHVPQCQEGSPASCLSGLRLLRAGR